EDVDGSPQQRLRLVDPAGLAAQDPEVVERGRERRMIRSEDPLSGGERATEQGLGLRPAAGRDEADGQVVERGRDFRVVFAEGPLAYGEDAFVELHRAGG